MKFELDGVGLEMTYYGLTGYPKEEGRSTAYNIQSTSHPEFKGMELPSVRVIAGLARRHMGSPLEEYGRLAVLQIGIKGGISKERRARFLVALAARCTIIK